MIISRGRGYVFVHIPKTGGTALATALEARAMADDILIGDTEKARKRRKRAQALPAKGRVWKHSTIADMEGVWAEGEPGSLMVFALVRNPWDRVVSYYHWLRAQGFDHPAVHAAKALTFEGFVMDEGQGAALKAWPYGRYVEGAVDPVFVRLEQFEADFAPVAAHLGFGVTLERVNASARARDWRGYYSDTTRARVAEICAEDIARFGYGFEDGAAG